MVFGPTDNGPFWMSPEEKEKRRHDIIVQGQLLQENEQRKNSLSFYLQKI
jgi:hypothetical protein